MLECKFCGCTESDNWYKAGNDYYCDDCCENLDTSHCFVCDRDYLDDEIRFGLTYFDGDNHYNVDICDYCLDDLHYCNECDTYISDGWFDYDMDMCEACSRDHCFESVCSYHTRPEIEPLNGAKWSDNLIGIEIEIEQKDGVSKDYQVIHAVNSIVPNRSIWFNEDGSLNHTGIELITQPMTLDFLPSMHLDKVFEKLIELGYESYNTGVCGLHIHFSPNWYGYDSDNLVSLVNFVHSNRDDFERLSKRRNFQYCTIPSYTYDDIDDMRYYVDCSDFSDNHCIWLNKDPGTETLEIRLMRGTLNYDSFEKSIRLWCYLIEKSKSVPWIESSNPSSWLNDMPIDLLDFCLNRNAFRQSWTGIVREYEKKEVKQLVCA